MFLNNNNHFYSKIYLSGDKADIILARQTLDEKFSHVISAGVVPRWDKSFKEEVKLTPIYNMSSSFNEVSMEWTDEKIIWKLNNQSINDVDLQKLFSGKKADEQILYSFRLFMALTLKREFYNDPNLNLNNTQKPCLYIDDFRVYNWKETEIPIPGTISYPVANNTMTTVVNPVANNSTTTVVNDAANNSMNTIITPVLLVILVIQMTAAIICLS
jgi:hypothetical protein